MSRFKSKMLAVALAATTVLSSVVPSAALAAEPADADNQASTVQEAAVESEPEEDVQEDIVTDETPTEGSGSVTVEPAGDEIEQETENNEPVEDETDTDPSEDAGTADTGNTTAPVIEPGTEPEVVPEVEPEEEPEKKEEEIGVGRFSIKFDSEGGVVKVILSSDEGASEDDPSYKLEKTDGRVRVTERSGNTYDAAMTEEGYVLDVEEKEGTDVKVVADSAEGYQVSQYAVSSDAGGEKDTGFGEKTGKFSYTASVDKNSRTVFEVEFEKDEEVKAENGTVTINVGSAGGTVTVTNGDNVYTIVKPGKGDAVVTDKDGNAVETTDDYDLSIEDEIGKVITVKAVADKGAQVTAFTVIGTDGNEEATSFDAENMAAELEQQVTIAEGHKAVNVSFVDTPEFSAEKKVGKYVVKIHADAGVLPKGTRVSVKELKEKDAKPYAEKAENMAEAGMAMAVIDITFKDFWGREIQPAGMVDVTFENAAEEDSTMSVYHAPSADVNKMEELKAEEKDKDLTVKSDSFSPFVLLAATAEPNWTKGGKGTSKDVSNKISFTMTNPVWFDYVNYGLGSWSTVKYTMKMNDGTVGTSVCLDPRRDGNGVSKSDKVYQVDAPMLVKAVYYGAYGPGKATIQEVTGTTSEGTNNIVQHVAVSEIRARLGLSTKSSVGDGFRDTNAKLQELVKKFVKKIEDLPVPDNYYLYVAVINNANKQDFGFGCTGLVDGKIRLHKTSSTPDITDDNGYYTLHGAKYWLYRNKADAEAKNSNHFHTLTVGWSGMTESYELDAGTYYAREVVAPDKGYMLNDHVYTVKVEPGKMATGETKDAPYLVQLQIIKKGEPVPEGQEQPSLAGAKFDVFSDKAMTKKVGTLTTDETGKTNVLNDLPLGKYYAKETKAPEGYELYPGTIEFDATTPKDKSSRRNLYKKTVTDLLEKAGIRIVKQSADPEITNDNECYSLAGAEFEVYSDEACTQVVTTLVTDEEGMTPVAEDLPIADYWIKEVKAPAGYYANPEVFKVTGEMLEENAYQEVLVPENPKDDPVPIRIVKKGADGTKGRSLAGTQFEYRFYNGYYGSESELPAEPTRRWVIEAKDMNGVAVADLNTSPLVEGDEYYRNEESGMITLPLGTVTITEYAPADGYENDPDFGNGASMYIGQVREDDDGDATVVTIQGTSPVSNSLTVEDTPVAPVIRTLAVDVVSDSHTAYAGGEVHLQDTIYYEGLVENTEYKRTTTLMDKETGEPFKDKNGEAVVMTGTFTTSAEFSDTTVADIAFEADQATLAGKTLVVTEKIEGPTDEYPTLVHNDLNDEAQTIYFPRIGTTLTVKEDGTKICPANSKVTLVDRVAYENMAPGEDVRFSGWVMNKATGEPLVQDGKEVEGIAIVTTDGPDGVAEVEYEIDTTGLDGAELVVFEEAYVKGMLVADHKKLDDLGQTVYVPGISTDVHDGETEEKTTLAAEDRIEYDDVKFKKLAAGKTYTIETTARVQDEGAESWDDAEVVETEIVSADANGYGTAVVEDGVVKFTPEGEEGSSLDGIVTVGARIDASHLAGKKIVFGETVKYEGKVIAMHTDLFDDSQTVRVPSGETMAIDTETGIKNALAADGRIMKDTFKYSMLETGKEYRFTGKVMISDVDENGNIVKDEEGRIVVSEIDSVMVNEDGTPVENGYVPFTPEEEEGTLDLYYAIDASEIAGRDVTVFETVTMNGAPVIIHEEMNGTQTVYIPDGGTHAIDSETRDQVAFPDEKVSTIDTFDYKNLIPGETYTSKVRVMRKTSGEEIPSTVTAVEFKEHEEDDEVDGSVERQASVSDNVITFVPDSKKGSLLITAEYDASELQGEDVVLFERVFHNGKEVIIHENLENEPQTIHFPTGRTMASDPDNGERIMKAGGEVTVKDIFEYENIIPDADYALHGQVMLVSEDGQSVEELGSQMVDSDGNPVDEWVFAPAEKDGTEAVYLKFDSTDLAGRSVVIFERMDYINPETGEKTLIAVHEDPADDNQVIHFPTGGTTALDSETGTHTAYADEDVTIVDRVKFVNMIPGKTANVTGVLHDKETGKPVLVDGKELTSTRDFVPETADGYVDIEFHFNGVTLAGKTVVAFEKVTVGGKEVFVHANIEDEEQTIFFPEIHTVATDKADGDHEISYKGTVTINDDVEYKNLTEGYEYRAHAVLMSKASGNAATVSGNEITGDKTFTADKDGHVLVDLTFDSTKLKAGEYVVFETLYEINPETGEEKIVAVHKDINDKSQTVKRPEPPKPPKGSRTGDDSHPFIWIAIFTAALAGAGILIVRRRKLM